MTTRSHPDRRVSKCCSILSLSGPPHIPTHSSPSIRMSFKQLSPRWFKSLQYLLITPWNQTQRLTSPELCAPPTLWAPPFHSFSASSHSSHKCLLSLFKQANLVPVWVFPLAVPSSNYTFSDLCVTSPFILLRSQTLSEGNFQIPQPKEVLPIALPYVLSWTVLILIFSPHSFFSFPSFLLFFFFLKKFQILLSYVDTPNREYSISIPSIKHLKYPK